MKIWTVVYCLDKTNLLLIRFQAHNTIKFNYLPLNKKNVGSNDFRSNNAFECTVETCMLLKYNVNFDSSNNLCSIKRVEKKA